MNSIHQTTTTGNHQHRKAKRKIKRALREIGYAVAPGDIRTGGHAHPVRLLIVRHEVQP